MATRDDVAVIVLAAGAGTRMRSDIPKVLHPLAGRSMLSHVLHAVANVSPKHLAVVVSKDRNQLARAIAELVDQIGDVLLGRLAARDVPDESERGRRRHHPEHHPQATHPNRWHNLHHSLLS